MNPVNVFYTNGRLRAQYYLNDLGNYHNSTGPAYQIWNIIGQLTYILFKYNGKIHNVNGPARIWYTDEKITNVEYWFDGIEFQTLSEWQYAVKTSCLK